MQVDDAVAGFSAALRSGRLAQAYVLIGPPRGAGRAVAERVLQLLFCEQAPRTCGACRGCRLAAEHAHPDVLWVEPQLKSRAIAIGAVRDLQARVYQTAYESGWKACVVVGADRLRDAAANAFLKTLEEPPPRTLFLLLTDAPQFLLPTVRSRCQPVTVSSGQDALPAELYDAVTAILADRPGTGGVVTSLARADRLSALLQRIKDEAVAVEKERAGEEAVETDAKTIDARANARFRELRTRVLRCILDWYRDLLLLACGGPEEVVIHAGHLPHLRAQAATLTVAQALDNLATVDTLNRRLERNLPESAALPEALCALRG